jgi:hypothetical protein
MRRILLTFSLLLVAVLPASAQQLKLDFNEGLVSLDATAVPVRAILTEWAKLGGTKVIGGERITGSPLTLKLENVPEARALEIVLRSVAGYMAAPRSATATPGASMYDRILVLATSAAPAPAPVAVTRQAPNQGGIPGGNNRFVPQRQRQVEEQDVEPEEEPDLNPPNAPAFTFPNQQNGGQPGMFQNPGTTVQPPFITVNPYTGVPQNITINPATPGTAPTFGAPSPGMIIAPPPGQQPQQPGIVVRPPGEP